MAYKIHEHSKAELTNAEHLWVEIQTKLESFVVGVVYRHPDENTVSIDRFSNEFNELLLSLNCEKKEFYCVGDFNVDLMKITNKHAIRRYASMLLSCNCRCLIDVPTRVNSSANTLIDHIYTNSKKNSLKSGVLSNIDISDHYSIFTIIPICKNKSKKLENCEIRDMKNFDKEEFLITLKNELNSLFVNNTLSINELFDKFVAIFADVVNDFASIRKATRKEKKTQAKTMGYKEFVEVYTNQKQNVE